MDDDEKIIRPRFGDPPLVVDETGAHCQHSYLSLRKRDERVICRSCGREVSAFDILCKLARDWSWATHYGQEIDERTARIEELRKEEALLKARVRSAVKRAPEPRAAVFVEEALRRLESASEISDLNSFDRWRFDYRWIEPGEQRRINNAYHAARERLQARHVRRRGVTVVKGGKE